MNRNSVLSVAWSPDGQRALSGAEDKTVRRWEVESGRCLRVLAGHTELDKLQGRLIVTREYLFHAAGPAGGAPAKSLAAARLAVRVL